MKNMIKDIGGILMEAAVERRNALEQLDYLWNYQVDLKWMS